MNLEDQKRRPGRPRLGEAAGPRAAWAQEYYAKPEVKEQRREYMQKWRERQKKAVQRQWTSATEPPDSDRIVDIVLQVEGGGFETWIGYFEDDGWFTAEGDGVYVTHWMERPKAP